MNAADSPSQRETQLPDLDTLDPQFPKALVLVKQAELDSRTAEIENLKLLGRANIPGGWIPMRRDSPRRKEGAAEAFRGRDAAARLSWSRIQALQGPLFYDVHL